LAPPLVFTSRTGYIFKKAAGFSKKLVGFSSKARQLLKFTGGLFPKRLRSFHQKASGFSNHPLCKMVGLFFHRKGTG